MMVRSPWQAGAMLLALAACAAPPAETPMEAETPVVAAPETAIAEAAPEESAAPEEPAVIEEPAAPEPAVIEPVAPEPPLDPGTQAIIENAIAALAPPAAAPPEAVAPAPPAPEPPVIEAAPTPDIDDDPERLMGLAGGALAELLGEPGFRREDADAQVWQYRGRDCLLDVYLYRDGGDAPHRVTYYEFRGDAAGRPCFRALLLAQAR